MAQSFNLLLTLALFGGFCVGAVFLQIFLSKARSKLPGLILPIVTFGYSLFMILSFAMFNHSKTTVIENGAIIEQRVTSLLGDPMSVASSMAFAFLLCNISTGILLAIYFTVRNRRKRAQDVQKMSVQDIE